MLNLKFYKGEDLYSDGVIELELLDAFEKGKKKEEILKKDNRWPILYHLAPERRNLLEWYDFKPNSSLLEIGAGCGALTGLFCEKLDKVTALELSLKRAKIIESRYKEFKNLEIVVGNFEDVEFEQKYDYITLIGVLEYSRSFINSKEPYKFLFEKIKKYLKEDGILIIAIENRFGIKYWAGAREDHTGKLFEGLEGYRSKKVETFGKKELENLLKENGFKEIFFYYPYPDYKLCSEIFSDFYLPTIFNYFPISESYDNNRFMFFNESDVIKNIIKNEQFPFFSNSFLLFTSTKDNIVCNNRKVIYTKINRRRDPKFQMATIILEEQKKKETVKRIVTEEGRNNIIEIINNYEKLKKNIIGNNLLLPKILKHSDEEIVFEFIEGRSYTELLLESLLNEDKEKFENLLLKFKELLLTNIKNISFDEKLKWIDFFDEKDKQEFVNDRFLSIGAIDLIFENIIVNDNINYIIDIEWVFDGVVPIDFIIYRAVRYFSYEYNKELSFFYSDIRSLLKIFMITEKKQTIFEEVESKFQQERVLNFNNSLIKIEDYKKDTISITEEILKKKIVLSAFFLFRWGENFNNFENKEIPIDLKNRLNIFRFNMSNKGGVVFVKIILAPTPLIIRINKIFIYEGNTPINIIDKVNTNAFYNEENTYYFFTNMPEIYFSFLCKVNSCYIEFHIEYLKISEEATKEIYNKILILLQRTRDIMLQLEIRLKKREEELLKKDIELKTLEKKYKETMQKLTIDGINNLKDIEEEILTYVNSKSWKITKLFRKISRLMKKLFKKISSLY